MIHLEIASYLAAGLVIATGNECSYLLPLVFVPKALDSFTKAAILFGGPSGRLVWGHPRWKNNALSPL